jgi:hypothetical protein
MMKFEFRNPKFETSSNDQMLNVFEIKKFRTFEFWKFEFVSSFDIWISDFSNSAYYP